ncbi:PPE family protein [Mycobacterium kansasii]|uniref:PPE family protein n=1 Tax=Mycobacterium kansasii TaxID=1768 RepID=A0A1V3XEZ6_MYCKA|nr:PPE family protein [Mycobacterium kansasii]
MNFSVLPPEINSLRMFAGAGAQPMLAAATAWGSLADELQAAASSFTTVTSGLANGAWQGPAAAAMAAAAAPYASWLSAAAASAAGTAGRPPRSRRCSRPRRPRSCIRLRWRPTGTIWWRW